MKFLLLTIGLVAQASAFTSNGPLSPSIHTPLQAAPKPWGAPANPRTKGPPAFTQELPEYRPSEYTTQSSLPEYQYTPSAPQRITNAFSPSYTPPAPWGAVKASPGRRATPSFQAMSQGVQQAVSKSMGWENTALAAEKLPAHRDNGLWVSQGKSRRRSATMRPL